jgi:hypothetical protein
MYAPTLMPSGDLAPSIIGFAAPTVVSLLDGQVREPISKAGGKRKPPVIKKLTKKPKIASPKKPADNNPPLDSDVEEFLDEAIMEEEIDKAAADISDTEDQSVADPKPADVATPPRSPAQSDIQATPKPHQRKTIRKVKVRHNLSSNSIFLNMSLMFSLYSPKLYRPWPKTKASRCLPCLQALKLLQ